MLFSMTWPYIHLVGWMGRILLISFMAKQTPALVPNQLGHFNAIRALHLIEDNLQSPPLVVDARPCMYWSALSPCNASRRSDITGEVSCKSI